MKKRLFAIMLALAMLLVAVPALAEEGEIQEQDQVKEMILCATEGCNNEVANKGDFCKDCAANVRPQSEQNPTEENKDIQEPAVKENKNVQGSTVTDDPNQNQQSDKKETKQDEMLNDPVQPDNGHVCKLSYIFDNSYPNGKCVHKVTCGEQGCDKNYPQSEDCIFDTEGWSTTNPKYDVDNTVRPTCEQGGKGAVKCSKCDHISYMETAKLGHDYEYHWGTWDCKTKTITAYRKCKRAECNVMENPTTISFSEKGRDTWYSCGKKYTTVYYKVVAKYSDSTAVEYTGKAACTYSTSDYCRPDWYYDPCYYNNPCGHWGCGNVCTRYSNCVPCQNYRTTFRVGGYNCLATPKTGDVSVIGMALISLAGAGAAIMGKKRK